MKKNIIIISIICVLILCIVGMVSIKNNSNNLTSDNAKNPNVNKMNNDSDIISDQVYKNLSITDVSVVIDKQNKSTYTATITNLEDTNSIETINVVFKDKDGNIIDTLTGFIGLDLKKGEQTIISSFTDLDLSNATSIEYKEGN